MRTVVTFRSGAFNTAEVKDDFINPGCFGDDVARWLVERLRDSGVDADDEGIGQEDFGWYVVFHVPAGPHCVVLGFRPGDDSEAGCWIAEVERQAGLLGSILGRRKRGISSDAVAAVHDALQGPEIANVVWHDRSDFDAGNEHLGSSEP